MNKATEYYGSTAGDYLSAFATAVSPEKFFQIAQAIVKDAIDGDPHARDVILRFAFERPLPEHEGIHPTADSVLMGLAQLDDSERASLIRRLKEELDRKGSRRQPADNQGSVTGTPRGEEQDRPFPRAPESRGPEPESPAIIARQGQAPARNGNGTDAEPPGVESSARRMPE